MTAEHPLEEHLGEFLAGPWGEVAEAPKGAENKCKRASLALMARLERAGVPVGLWNFAGLRPEAGWGQDSYFQHFVVVHDGEAIDVTARQFIPSADVPLREPLGQAKSRWENAQRVDLENALCRWHVHKIPSNWRDLADVGPPGDLPGWPYEGQK